MRRGRVGRRAGLRTLRTLPCAANSARAVLARSEIPGTREAGTGAEALRQMAARPDLVVLDVVLPDMDGREVCGRIKADPATAGTPVLMVSGRAVAAAEQARAVDGGADGYLTKPADPE